MYFWRWLASSGGQKLSVSPSPFKRSIYRLSLRPATPISHHLWIPNITLFCICTDYILAIFFSMFLFSAVFGPNGGGRPPPNSAVSVSNAPFSPRNYFSALIFGQKHISDPSFGQVSPFIHLGPTSMARCHGASSIGAGPRGLLGWLVEQPSCASF